MPSPVGHSLAGLCGYMAVRNHVDERSRPWLLVGAVAIANLADIDFLLSVLLGDPTLFHHQATHSLTMAIYVGLIIGVLASRFNVSPTGWGTWGGGVYLSHVVLDVLVDDPTPPFGVQLFWPLSEVYVISPVTPLARFDYYHPTVGILSSLLSLHNVGTVLREFVFLASFVGLAWYFSLSRRRSP